MADCKACGGTGICSKCKGDGYVKSYKIFVGSTKCKTCDGKDKCPECKGTGKR